MSRFPLLALLLLAGCTTVAVPAPSPATSAAATPAVPAPRLEIQWARTSAEHDAIYEQTYRLAGERLRAGLDTLRGTDWGVILDADETVLDNSLYQRERAAVRLGYSSESWDAWVARQEATALPGAVAFTALVRRFGGRVVIVTNRADAGCPATRANLTSAGIAADAVLCQTGPSDKNPRFEMVQAGTAGLPPLRIAMWVGDNIRDFPALSQTNAAGDFGGRFWVLPNPMYGSWDRNPDPADAP